MRYTYTVMIVGTSLDDAAAVRFAREIKVHVPDDVLARLAAQGLPPDQAVTDVQVVSIFSHATRKEVLNG